MSQAIKGAAMLAGAAALIGGAVLTGGADFAVAFALSSTWGSSLLASLAIGGISMEAGAIANSLMTHRGTAITTRQTAAPRQIIYGTQRVAGVIIYDTTTGSRHDQYNMIIAIAGHQIEAIENLYLDGRKVYWSPGSYGNTTRNGVNFGGAASGGTKVGPGGAHYNFDTLVYCEARYGDQVSGDVMSSMTANDPNWAATSSGNPYVGGCTYVYLKVEYDVAMFPSKPEIRITVRGKKDILDPRTGTRGYTTNWALIVADVLADSVFGVGDVGAVNTAQLIAAANVCDEQVALAAGGSEARYSTHWHYDTAVAPGDVLQTLQNAAAGRLSRIGGEWFIWPAYWQGPSASFDESALTGPLEWTPQRSQRELSNRVTGTYTAPNYPYNTAGNLYDSNGWYDGTIANTFAFAFQPTNYPQYAMDVLHGYASDALLEADSGVRGAWDATVTYDQHDAATVGGVIYLSLIDGNLNNDPTTVTTPAKWVKWQNQLPMEVSQNCVLSIAQAQRVAKIMLLRNRQQGKGEFPLDLAAWAMQPVDVMSFTFAAQGWYGKQLEIASTSFYQEEQEGVQAIRFKASAQETASSVYEWHTSEELSVYDVPSNPTSTPYTIDPPSGLALLSDSTTAYSGADGVTYPRILATWTAPPDVRVTQVQVQYQLAGAGGWIDAGAVDVASTSVYISGVVGGSTYNVHIRSLTKTGAVSVWVETDGCVVGAPGTPLQQWVTGVTPTSVGGSTTIFSVPTTPTAPTDTRCYRNGLRLQYGSSKDFTVSGAQITLTIPLDVISSPPENLIVDYR